MAIGITFGDRFYMRREQQLKEEIFGLEFRRNNLSTELQQASQQAELNRQREKLDFDKLMCPDQIDRERRLHTVNLEVAEAYSKVREAEAKVVEAEKLLTEKQEQFDKMAKLVSDAADARVKSAEARAATAEKMVADLMTHLPKVNLDGGLNVNVKSERKKA